MSVRFWTPPSPCDAYEELCSKLPSKQEDRTEGKEKEISSDGNGCCTKIC